MSAALSRYLKDFGAVAPPPAMPEPEIGEMPLFADIPEAPQAPAIDLDAIRQEAFEQGRAAAEAELSATHQAGLDAAVAMHGEEMETLRVRYETEAAQRIGDGLRQIAALLAETISAETASALAPVMTEVVTEKAVAELAVLIKAAILEGAVGPIAVSGPKDLFERLAAQFDDGESDGDNESEKTPLLTHVEAADIDLSATIGESVLVTRMSAWADGLKKVWA